MLARRLRGADVQILGELERTRELSRTAFATMKRAAFRCRDIARAADRQRAAVALDRELVRRDARNLDLDDVAVAIAEHVDGRKHAASRWAHAAERALKRTLELPLKGKKSRHGIELRQKSKERHDAISFV